MTKQQTITELLHQFQLDIQLPEKVLSINVEGIFDNMSKDNLLLDFVNADCRMDKGYFECYVFEGENCKCIICPNNKLRMISIYSKVNESYEGCSYDFDGDISFRS